MGIDDQGFIAAAIGKRIAHASLRDDMLRIEFDDASWLSLVDDGQSCCEHRYMRTDDEPSDFAGAVLMGIDLRDVTEDPSDYCHEIQFLVVRTSAGDLTMSSHNEHNGYYGGFWIRAHGPVIHP